MGTESLHPSERGYAAWLCEVERGVILPLKWLLLAVCALVWLWSRRWAAPGTGAFALFFIVAMLNAAEHYFFARDRVTPREMRPFIYGSFLLDALGILALIQLDHLDRPPGTERAVVTDFYFLFILQVLRGFALFRDRRDNALGFAAVSGFFCASAAIDMTWAPLVQFVPSLQKLALVWGSMLLAQGFVSLVNASKEEQLRAREREVRSESLAAIGELAAGVAHEVNNPVGIIKTYSDYLLKSTPEGDPLREDFETIRREAERCEEIVKRMVAFSEPRLHGIQSVDLGALATEVSAFVFHAGREGERVEAEVAVRERVPAVKGDPIQLRQALMNVLLNARQILNDYAKGGAPPGYEGRVRIEVSRAAGPRPPVRIAVSDNGPGITPQDAERAFEAFFTRRAQGTGLGLSITRRIVEAHNGTISIGPRGGGGTEVLIEIPIEGEERA